MDIKEIVLKVADPLRNKVDGISHMQSNQGLVAFAEALIAEVAKGNEPVAWRFTAPGITKLDSCPHGGKWHGLYTSDQVAAAILKATKPLEEEIDRLESESEEYAQLQSRCFDGGGSHASVFDEVSELRAQLAAAQLNNKLLRDALQAYIDEHEECQDADDWMAMMCSMEAHHAADEALSLPASTEALDKYVAEKVKDSESRTGNQSPCYTIALDMAVRMWEKHYKTDAPNWEPLDDFMGVLSQISNMLTGLGNVEKITRQRDLAVEALKTAYEVATNHDDRLPFDWAVYCEMLWQAIKESEAK